MSESFCLLYCPVPDEDTAVRLGRGLLEARLVACVNIMPQVRALYWWEGQIADEREALLLAKTLPHHQDAVTAWLCREHPYQVPCIAFFAADTANAAFQAFVSRETTSSA